MNKLLFILIILGLLPSQIIAEVSFSILGNKRTATSHIEKLSKRCLSEKPSAELQQCLLNAKIFSKVKVLKEGTLYKITVKERWTLIPVPVLGFGGEFPRYGLMLIETNAFGRGKMLMTAATFGNDGHMAVLMYKDRSVAQSNFTAQILGSLYKQDQYAYKESDKIYGYHQDRSSLFAGLGYRLSKDLEFGMTFGYSANSFKSLKNVSTLDPFNDLYLFTKIQYDGANYKFYFNEGLQFRLRSKNQLRRSDEGKLYWELDGLLRYQKAVWGESALQLSVLGGTSTLKDVRSSLEMGESRGFRGSERASLWLKSFVTLSADYQIPLRHFAFGTWTVAPFIDWAFFESVVDIDAGNTFNSFGIGTYLYITKIALPGMGLEFGHNSKFRNTFISFTVGFGF